MTDKPIQPEVSDEAFECLERQVEALREAMSAIHRPAIDAAVTTAVEAIINPFLADLAIRERDAGQFTLH